VVRAATVVIALLLLAARPGWAGDPTGDRAETAAARAEAAADRSEAAAARAEAAVTRLERLLDELARREETRRRPGVRRPRQ
jgi:hypothetical protein